MQKQLLLCAAFAVLFISFSCKKSSPTPTVTSTYQPLTTNSEWNYTVTGTTTASYKLTATATDTLINSRTYKIFSNSNAANEYYNKSNTDYFRYAKPAEFNNQPVELLNLKEDLAKGQTWVETKTISVNVTGYGLVPVTTQFTFTVADKGIDHTVNGVVFKDVIKITAVPSFTALGSTIPVTANDLQYFYAKNVGLIYSKTILTIPLASVNINTETKLGAYTIK